MSSKTEHIIEFLKNKIPELSGIYLFGSYADKQLTPESDIDIGFLTLRKITPVEKWKIQEELASKLDKNIDLVDMKDASVVLRSQIIENGIRIYCVDNYECDKFEMLTYSLYADLNESRRQILNDYKEKYGRNTAK